MNYINFDLLALNNVWYGFLEDLIKSRTLYQFFFNLLLSFKPRRSDKFKILCFISLVLKFSYYSVGGFTVVSFL